MGLGLWGHGGEASRVGLGLVRNARPLALRKIPRWFLRQVALVVKNLPANAEDPGDLGSIPGPGRSPGEGNGNSLQYSCWRILMDRGAWRAPVHGVAKSRTRLR